ncbi:N-acetylmuramoyl-L-alanine amidase family protein [Endomicrobium proavitum]|uniref:N-acetylmuramoyl-L-alanine amidase n=1 Tax=Endomicrobium proavitum TaxID=1408281 RepID=A0A0G3WFE7_9BACT|nr:N-acetylmuramoyl-L-alanine amidase [Endomicrobium proavitum]AKL97386.1 N-acetylmuramoyl-L-alanine amidase [Endomicrobium proavitum]
MKKILFLLLAVMVICANVFAQEDAPASKKVNAVIDGQPYNGINAYPVSENTKYFSVKEIAAIYGLTIDWKQLSAEVILRAGNRKIDIKANSTSVVFGKKRKKMSLPSRLIKNEIYIPPEIITSKEFSDIVEADALWNADSLILNVKRRENISSIRYFTTPEKTELIIGLTEPLPYTISKATGAILLTVHRGKIQRNLINLDNGAVRDIFSETEGKAAYIQINLMQTPKVVYSHALKNPDRISVEIAHSKEVDISESAATTVLDNSEPAKERTEEISEIVDGAETGDNSDLAAVPVVTFEEANIADDSYVIIDDTTTLPDVVPQKTPKKPYTGRKKIIVVDAGHGGEDPGAVGPNATKEKIINLAIALELKNILNDDDEFEVILTRKDDTFIPLVERTNIANENNADLFISIHCNANFDRAVNGFEVYFLSEKATDSEAQATATLENSVIELEGKPTKKRALLQDMLWSMMLNEYINDSSELGGFIAAQTPERLKISNRGVKQASFYVLRGSQMPAVLVESAFISNYSEESKLGTKTFQTAIADSIYEGIKNFYAHKEKKQNNGK